MTARRWAWSAFALSFALAFAWLIASSGAGPQPTSGVVQIVESEPVPAASPSAMPAAAVKRVPLVATHESVSVAVDQAYLVANEKRNPDWAAHSEAAIGRLMRTIPYVGGAKQLEIKCAANACEVSGFVDVDPSTGSFTPIWEKLERDTAGDQLRKDGLERSAAVFDTGRNPDEFKLYYRRVAR